MRRVPVSLVLIVCLLGGSGGSHADGNVDLDTLIQRVADGPKPAAAAATALEAARSLADADAAVSGLRRLALAVGARSSTDHAFEIMTEARAVAREGAVDELELVLLDESEANLLLSAGRIREALPLLERALAERRRREEPTGAAFDLNQIALALLLLGEYERSVSRSHEALQLAEEAGAPAVEARSRFLLGMIDRQLERYDQALALFRSSAAAAERAGDTAQLLRAVNEEANALFYLGRTDEAVERKRVAIEAAEATGDRFALASCRHDMGVLLHGQQRHREALEAYRVAHDAFLQFGSLREAAVSASNVSAVLLVLEIGRAHV